MAALMRPVMRPAWKAVFVSLVAATVLMSWGSSSPAWAQKTRVVIEPFKGPNADRVRLAVVRAALKQRLEVVAAKKVAMVEADLGLIRASDNYSAVARELKVNAFIGGTVMPGRRPRVRVVVRSADGGVVGQSNFAGINLARLIRNVSGGAGPKLAALAGSARNAPMAAGGRGRAEGPVFSPGTEATPPPPAVAAAEPPTERAAKEAPEPAEASEPKVAEAEDDPDADVEAEAEAPPARGRSAKAGAPGSTGLNLAFVMRMFSRKFTYNQNFRGTQQGYQAPEERYNNLPLVPAPGLAVEYFAMPYAGGYLSYNRAIAGSKDNLGSVYKTTAYDWSLGARGRFDVVGVQIEPTLGYVAKVFEIQNFGSDPTRIQVAPVSYRQVRLGTGVRLPLSSGAAISAGGAYLHTLGAGDILDPGKYFSGNALAGELFAGMTMPLGFAKGFDLRLGADFRRVAFAFAPNLGSMRIAGGAVDQYIGVSVGVGYNLDI
jgi:hypothetical protein